MPRQKSDFDSGMIRELAEIMAETGLTELELNHGENNLRLSRITPAAPPHIMAAPFAAPTAAPAAPAAPEGVSEAAPTAASAGEHPGTISSPMVGTVYLAPQPGADPFVSAGDRVNEGDTLMIIEAMKVMNPLPAPRAGTVKAVLVSDSQPVEFGDPLIIIE